MPTGAYGLRLDGVTSRYLADAPAEWPAVRVTRREREGERGTTVSGEVGEDRARFVLGRVEVVVDRAARAAEILHVGALDEDDAAHPLTGPIGAAFAHWDGGHALHAGAFAAGDGAWGVVGGMEAGKSTLMGALALAGVAVLSDDMLVARRAGGEVVAAAGPRCVDLRPPSAEHLAAEGGTVAARGGTRDRLPLGPAPAEAPLRGWFALEWGEAAGVTPMDAAERYAALSAGRKWHLAPRDPRLLLDLAALPAWRVVRPRTWAAMEPAVASVLAVAERG
jgi:hypothetical protein